MAKFYVQSGTLRGTVDCFDEQCAAVWVIQRTLDRGLKEYSVSEDPGKERDDFFADAIFDLDDEIRVSERGFDRDDALSIDLHDAFVHWYQLKKAIQALSQSWDERLGD
jgi:hypothetical protein